MGVESIILGEGIFTVGTTVVALTRGGGKFSIEREYKEIEADGDFGAVKGRIRKVRSKASLTLNALELLPANMTKFFPAMTLTTSAVDKDVLTASTDIADADYNDTVSFTGLTKGGKQVYIEIQNAINLENFEWEMADKEEIVQELTYTATYLENARTTEPWKIEFTKGTTYTATFTVTSDGTEPIEGASVVFHNETKTTNESGVAVFTGVGVANNQAYTITAGGYETLSASINVDGDETQTITMTGI